MTGREPCRMESLMNANERRTRASREAADWWALLQADQMTKTEREQFVDWVRDSQTNIAEMLQLFKVHGALEQFREWADVDLEKPAAGEHRNVLVLPAAVPPPREDPTKGDNRRRTFRLFACAATLAAVAVVTAVLLPQFRGQWIATDRGERREVVLDDGSVVQIDPQTRLNVRFTASQRRVVLKEGRAAFRVAKNAQRPFRVEAGDTTVRAIGTAFGVDRRTQGHVVVTVSEGRVAVTSDALPNQKLRSAKDQVYLTANEQITVAMAGTPQLVRAVDSNRELAWAEGRLVFKNDTMADVIAEFNRYNRVQVTVADPALAARPITGVFDAANLEGFLAFLQNAAPVRIDRDEGQSIVISPRASL
jgi:transmembrane sensor